MRQPLFIILCLCIEAITTAQPSFGTESLVSEEKEEGSFPLSVSGVSAPLVVSSGDWPGVIRAFRDLQADIGKVTSFKPELFSDKIPGNKDIIIAGSIGKSKLINELINKNKIDVRSISGKWESFVIGQRKGINRLLRSHLKGLNKLL